jgi:hypothetical protein
MKKIITLLAIAFTMSTTAAFAAGNFDLTTTKTGLTVYGAKSGTVSTTSVLIGKASTGVMVGMNSATSGYAVWTQHKNGIKAYGSGSDSTSIYQATAIAGTPVTLNIPGGPNTAAFVVASGAWTTM